MTISEAINTAITNGWTWIVYITDKVTGASDLKLLIHKDRRGKRRLWCWDGHRFVIWENHVDYLAGDQWEATPIPDHFAA